MKPREMTNEQLIEHIKSDRYDRSVFAHVYLNRHGYSVHLNTLDEVLGTYDVFTPNIDLTYYAISSDRLVELALKEYARRSDSNG